MFMDTASSTRSSSQTEDNQVSHDSFVLHLLSLCMYLSTTVAPICTVFYCLSHILYCACISTSFPCFIFWIFILLFLSLPHKTKRTVFCVSVTCLFFICLFLSLSLFLFKQDEHSHSFFFSWSLSLLVNLTDSLCCNQLFYVCSSTFRKPMKAGESTLNRKRRLSGSSESGRMEILNSTAYLTLH